MNQRLFIRSDELEEAWKLFTPYFRESTKRAAPELCMAATGPIGAHYLASRWKVMGDTSTKKKPNSFFLFYALSCLL